MSIIQDALKKAHCEYVEKILPPAEERKAIRPKVEIRIPREAEKKLPSTRLGALLTIFTTLLLAYGFILCLQYIKIPDKVKDQLLNPDTKQESVPEATDSLKQPKPIPADIAPSVRPAFILSGIMYLEDKPQAIINGHVLEEGDKVNGATVLVIEKDCVLLDLNDTNIKVELSK